MTFPSSKISEFGQILRGRDFGQTLANHRVPPKSTKYNRNSPHWPNPAKSGQIRPHSIRYQKNVSIDQILGALAKSGVQISSQKLIEIAKSSRTPKKGGHLIARFCPNSTCFARICPKMCSGSASVPLRSTPAEHPPPPM